MIFWRGHCRLSTRCRWPSLKFCRPTSQCRFPRSQRRPRLQLRPRRSSLCPRQAMKRKRARWLAPANQRRGNSLSSNRPSNRRRHNRRRHSNQQRRSNSRRLNGHRANLRAILSEKQLQEVMVDFWFNHFNVFAQKDVDRWLLTSYERDVVRPHALGKFKDLLTAVAQSPAMLYYLDNFMSQVEQPAPPQKFDADGNPIPQPRRPGLNENYARELMELHTLGVDGGYTQKDVIEVARCFTGWTIGPRGNMGFAFRPRIHDRGEKTVLGNRIVPGGGIE